MTETDIIREVRQFHPSIKECAWSVTQGMGYFRCQFEGKRRAIAVETEHSGYFYTPGRPKNLLEVVSEIVVGLDQ